MRRGASASRSRRPAWRGACAAPSACPEREGVLVRAVEDGSPADRAGLERGDLIVAAAGGPVEDVDALYAALDAAGAALALTVVRGTRTPSVTVVFDGETAEV